MTMSTPDWEAYIRFLRVGVALTVGLGLVVLALGPWLLGTVIVVGALAALAIGEYSRDRSSR